jgi:hypothetical protein
VRNGPSVMFGHGGLSFFGAYFACPCPPAERRLASGSCMPPAAFGVSIEPLNAVTQRFAESLVLMGAKRALAHRVPMPAAALVGAAWGEGDALGLGDALSPALPNAVSKPDQLGIAFGPQRGDDEGIEVRRDGPRV